MTARNDITGDAIVSRMTSEQYRQNFDAIFRKAKAMPPAVESIDLAQAEGFGLCDTCDPDRCCRS